MGRIAVGAAALALTGFIGLTPTFAILLGTTFLAFGLAEVLNRNLPDPTYAEKEEHIELGQLLQNHKFRYATLAGIADSFSSASLYLFIPFLLTETKGIPDSKIGWYIGVFFCGYFAGRLGLGRLADRYGSANTLMASKVAMSALLVAFIFVFGVWTLGVVIFLLGIFTRGSSPIIRTMVADSVQDKSNFHNAFGTYSFASRGSSAFCRPIFMGVGSSAGWPAVFYIAAGVSLATLYPASKYKKAAARPLPHILSEPSTVLSVEQDSQHSSAA
jgi:MFS family permease